jgi:anti-sigma-K factor RskA
MTHDELRELTGGYVLGALSEADRQALEAHLATCADCAAEVQALREVARALAYATPQRDLPPGLRERVLRAAVAAGGAGSRVVDFAPAVSPKPTRSTLPAWFALAASIAAVAFGLYAMTLRQRIEILQDRLREATARAEDMTRQAQVAHAAADQARQSNAVLAASDVRRIDLAGQKTAPDAGGHAFWSPSQRLLVFTAANLPALRAGRGYQLWVIPLGETTPVSAGMLPLASDGSISTLAPPLTVDQIGAVAVSEEPASGVSSPTGDIVLSGAAAPR